MDTTRFAGSLLVIAALVPCPTGVAGQAPGTGTEIVENRGVVVSLGFGTGSRGVAGQLSLWGHRDHHVLGLRTASSFEFDLFGPSDSEEDYALLYGRRSAPGRTWGRVGIGPALVRVLREGPPTDCFLFICTYQRERSSTLGLAVQADGVVALFGPVGLTATLFGNLNSAASFGGATLGLAIGSVGSS